MALTEPETTRHDASCAAEIASRRQRSSWSDLGHAAIDDQFDAGDIATFVRSEKRHHFGNFVQGSGATEGYIAHDAVRVLLYLFFRHSQRIAIAWRGNYARTNSVHADFAVFKIRGESTRERTH